MYPPQYQEGIHFLFEHYTKIPGLVIGPTGIGKSEIPENEVRKLILDQAKDKEAVVKTLRGHTYGHGDIGFAYINMNGCEPADLLGRPIDIEVQRGGEKKQVTTFAPPDFLECMEQYPRGIAVFDEVNRMDLQVRQTYMQMLDRRAIGNIRIPDGWLLIQTANPADDDYQVSDFDKALVRRSCVMELQFDLDSWQTWGLKEYVSPLTGGHMNPRALAVATRLTNKGMVQKIENRVKPIPTAAGLTVCSELLDAGIDRVSKQLREVIFSGILGAEAATMLEASLKSEKLDSLLDRAMRGDEIKGEGTEVMTDLMFLFYDSIAKKPKEYGKQAVIFWQALPSDAKPVFAKACYSWFQQHKAEYAGFKKLWGAWCLENMYIMQGVEPE